MKRFITAITLTVFCIAGTFYLVQNNYGTAKTDQNEGLTFVKNPTIISKETTQQDRAEYFHKMLRDPQLGIIPRAIHAKEIAFAERLSQQNPNRRKAVNEALEWKEVGPSDVGGRTRALAMDMRDPNIILAGGASGGIWKSTNAGQNWSKKTDINSHLGVTALVQDPTAPDNWYYSTGEFRGSAGASGASFYGSGIYKSEDNGETWLQIEKTRDTSTSFDSEFDFITNIAISPTTGTLLISSNGFGIFRTTSDFENSFLSLGGRGDHVWAEVSVNSAGDFIAVISNGFGGDTPTQSPGVYLSKDDGLSWINITPSSFPSNGDRSVIGISESNPSIFFILTDTGSGAAGMNLHRFDISQPSNIKTSDRSSGIPDFGNPVGDLDPQFSYNMMVRIHPTNPNIVFVGATNLFRSTDGFSSVPPNSNGTTDSGEGPKYWIGGYDYDNDISQYPNQHPDQHNLIFYPNNPNKAISAHDGGLSLTNDITATPVEWVDLDDGYNVTQFYTVSIHPDADDSRIGGGTQDNGTPHFLFSLKNESGNSIDVSSGDGATIYLGINYATTSSQNGNVAKYDYNGNGLINNFSFSYITPINATDQQFIHPYAVNPSDENFMAYPAFDRIWINDQLLTISRNTSNSDGTSEGWTARADLDSGTENHEITALTFTNTNPIDRLYYGSSDAVDVQIPFIKRVDDVTANDSDLNIVIPNATGGSYVNDITVNPDDGDEVMVIMSNYRVKSIWHSTDAGSNWTDIEGNLAGEDAPSIRSGAIAATNESGTFYFVGTSVGLYYTDQLNGTETVWTRVAEDKIGNAIVSSLDYRRSDQILAVGTHGRGLFVGKIGNAVSNELVETKFDQPSEFTLNQNFPNPFNPTTNISFTLPSNAIVNLSVFDLNGRRVAEVYNNRSMAAGSFTASFDASNLASGTYLYQLEALPQNGSNAFRQTKTMTLIK
ncbi:MAG: T9SS type A sorting domain-containing protein [Balneolaceae bacterium]|nr:T9SS type A sorting domain-containing protein [Balneolaceae bacterium]